MLVAVVARVVGLAHEGLWLDEGWSVRVAGMGAGEILRTTAVDAHPPFYFLLLHFWIGLAGTGEAAVRLPSVVFGVLAVVLTGWLGERLYGRRVGMTAGLLAALSPFLIHYSQEARGNMLMLALSLASCAAFLRMLERPGAVRVAAYVIATVALLYTHNYGPITPLTHGVYLAVAWRAGWCDRRASVAGLAGIGLVGLAWLPWVVMLPGQLGKLEGSWIPRPGLRSLGHTFLEYCGSALLLVVFFGLCVAGAMEWRRGKGLRVARPHALLFTLLAVVLPNLLPFVASFVATPVYTTNSTIAAAWGVAVLAAAGVWRLGRGGGWAVGALAVLLIGQRVVDWGEPVRGRWREAAEIVATEASDASDASGASDAGAGDRVLVYPGYLVADIWGYYAERFGIGGEALRGGSVDAVARGIAARVEESGGGRVWVVSSREEEAMRAIEASLPGGIVRTFEEDLPARLGTVRVVRLERAADGE